MSLLCRLIGHRWREKYHTFTDDHMFRYTRWRTFAYCTRCGTPNPEITQCTKEVS